MPIHLKNKIIFIHIPKTGGQSILKAIGIKKGDKKQYYYHPYTHYTIEMISNYFNIDNYYKFTFVRNPYDRLISEYFWRLQGNFIGLNLFKMNANTNFSEFVKLIYNLYLNNFNNYSDWNILHFIPQNQFLKIDDSFVMDDIFKFEEFQSEWKKISKKVSIKLKKIENINKSRLRKNNNFLNYYNKNDLKMVNEMYYNDFKYFNYEMI